jgi:ankyrin repeat protein
LILLLNRDVAIGWPSFSGPVTPLHIAVASNNLDALRIILEYIGNESFLDMESGRLFDTVQPGAHLSCRRNFALGSGFDRRSIRDIQIDQESLEHEWMLSVENDDTQEGFRSTKLTTSDISTGSALHVAAYTNNIAAIKILLDHGATLDLRDANERTALHVAAEKGNLDCVETLLGKGALVETRDHFGWTPVMLAAKNGHLEVLKALLEVSRPAALSSRDAFGRGLLHVATAGHPEVFSYMLYQGLDPYMKILTEPRLLRMSLYTQTKLTKPSSGKWL